MAEFKYTGITQTERNCVLEQIKSRLNSGTAGYHLVLILFLVLRRKKIKVNICGTIILPAAWFGCETWSQGRTQAKGVEWTEVPTDRNKLRIGKLHDLCCSPDVIRVTTEEDEVGGTCNMCRGTREIHAGVS